MRRSRLYVASLLIIGAPASVGPGVIKHDDPLAEVAAALDQGRHWYATRLLSQLDGIALNSQEATLLAARADAGRGAWDAVVEGLQGAAWLDSTGSGEGRALLARGRLETGDLEGAATDYETFLEYSMEREPRALAEIGLARAQDGLGRGTEAAAAYGRAAEAVPEFEPWSAIRAAESLAPYGDTAAVSDLLDRAAAVPYYRRTLVEFEALENAGDHQAAVRLLLRAADSPASGDRSADLRTRAARILLEDGDTSAARGPLLTVVRSNPSDARDAAVLLADLPDLLTTDHQRLATAFERSNSPGRAAQQYQFYMDAQRLSTAERQRLQLKVGELLYRAGSYYASVEALEALVASEPESSIKARAEYYTARATYRRGWHREGRARLREVADRYPGTAWAIRSLSLLGDLYESAGNAARARAIYEELADRYSTASVARTARFRLGILAFLDGDYSGAREHFDRLRRSGRRDDLHIRATYWAARARLADVDSNSTGSAESLFRDVQARDPFGYYGLLAAERVGIDPWATLREGPEPAPIDPETTRRFELIVLLNRAGLDEEAKTVFESIMRSQPQKPNELLGLSLALTENGFGQEGVRVGWRVHSKLRGLWSTNVLRAIYPLAFEEIILAESQSRELEPYLLAAIARQESAFSPHVVSRAGARGLLQIMPATGRWWANHMGVHDYSTDLLFHPEINVHLGAAYFADLSRRYGELQISLVAYNAGPTRARRWRERPEYRTDPELFTERIPFSETRGYVRGVQRQLRIYRELHRDALERTVPAD
jgi:soluble lytic murein transglycosylase